MFASDKYLSRYLIMHYNRFPNTLQLEISSNCNLGCPGCVRTQYTSIDQYQDPTVDITIENLLVHTHPDIKKNQFLSFDVFKQLLNSSTVQRSVERLEFIGTIDDPLMHPQFLDMIEYTVKNTELVIIIHTNASLRNPVFFMKMARLLGKSTQEHRVCFSIDGLEDTNHLYRRGSNFNKIMDNATAFLKELDRFPDSCVRTIWQYLIFDWNKHQVDTAQQRATDMGFTEFASRNDRALLDIDFKHEARLGNRGSNWSNLKARMDARAEDPISCKMQHMYFINFQGEVWPCCFFNNRKYQNIQQDAHQVLTERFAHYGDNWNNLNYYSLDEILKNEFYENDLVASWKSCSHGSGHQDRVTRCTQTCSKSELQRRPLQAYKPAIL